MGVDVSAETIARWQFGITTVYHFIFVPLTIGLAPLVAGLQTAHYRTGKLHYLRASKFFGKLLLINFAIGVVTGLVQEFQFGMNWSNYSRFVGDVFGAPLAMEGLVAFFLESTFLGLWIFGWGRLSPRLHQWTIWLVAIGTAFSAYFILAANSWMQHPVGYHIGTDGRPKLTSIGDVLLNPVQLVTFPHVMAGAAMTGGGVMACVSAWYLRHRRDDAVFRPTLKLGLWTVLAGGVATLITGDLQARVMTAVQPMKMAAAEALYHTTSGASFSIFTWGNLDGTKELFSLRIPDLLSFMATGSFTGQVEGINNLQQEYVAQYGPGNYMPMVPVTYWGFRLMIGFGMLAALIALVVLWLMRSGRTPRSRWVMGALVVALVSPFVANSFGWIFTEVGRQPWTVFGLLKTVDSASPTVSAADVLTSLIVFTLLYGVLAVVDLKLMVKYARVGPPTEEETRASLEKKPPLSDSGSDDDDEDADSPLSFAY